MDGVVTALVAVAFELALFAGVIFALFGLDDLIIDALYFSRLAPRNHIPIDTNALPIHRFAVFVPAWREDNVIGAMLRNLSETWRGADIRVYVGVYPNDPATMTAASTIIHTDSRMQLVINDHAGPTTKGACLNHLWSAMQADTAAHPWQPDAIIIHDAEDCVDPSELAALSDALRIADYAQIPVLPLAQTPLSWIGWHYADEFAESHAKEMPIRAALGSAMPLAGVGCAICVSALAQLDDGQGPFAADSLTEDYELGLRLHGLGAIGIFTERRDRTGRLVASRALFPHDLASAVAQKTRWLRGNAMDAWDRTGWPTIPNASSMQRLIDRWMLWRDRRAVIAAAAVLAAYGSMALSVTVTAIVVMLNLPFPTVSDGMAWLLSFNLVLLIWRLALRGWFTGRRYGLRQGMLSMFRQPVSNIILVMTAWRALKGYCHGSNSGARRWDKTNHIWPEPMLLRREGR
jgi:bacteriophage N4 adsorption protein B